MMSLRRFVELGYDEEEYNEYVEYEKSTRSVYNYEDEEEDDDESETD